MPRGARRAAGGPAAWDSLRKAGLGRRARTAAAKRARTANRRAVKRAMVSEARREMVGSNQTDKWVVSADDKSVR